MVRFAPAPSISHICVYSDGSGQKGCSSFLCAGRPQGSPLPNHSGGARRTWVGATLAVALEPGSARAHFIQSVLVLAPAQRAVAHQHSSTAGSPTWRQSFAILHLIIRVAVQWCSRAIVLHIPHD